jgi:hypothetical protein
MSDESEASRVERGIRIDLIIAVCALLISTLAAAASFWQARVLQDQLGAQVWPYVSVSENFTGTSVQIGIVNDGLGPAILRSATAAVDGAPKSNFIDIMHAVLGPHLVDQQGHKRRINLSISSGSPGTVLRPGSSTVAFGMGSKEYAVPFARAFSRMESRIRPQRKIRNQSRHAPKSVTTCCTRRQCRSFSTAIFEAPRIGNQATAWKLRL